MGNTKRIYKLQKWALRAITSSKYNAHTEPLFFKLKILPFDDLLLHHKLLLMHSIAHNYSTVNFPHFLTNLDVNTHRFTLRDQHHFFILRTVNAMVQKMPIVDFPLSWNNIDESLKDIASKNIFKKTVKLELLDKYANFRCNNTVCLSCMTI